MESGQTAFTKDSVLHMLLTTIDSKVLAQSSRHNAGAHCMTAIVRFRVVANGAIDKADWRDLRSCQQQESALWKI